LRLERRHEVIGRTLHLAREIELGDPALDDLFWITGSPNATAILTTDVRRETVVLPAAALAVLAGIRAAIAGR
jgi:hypothetical protein